MNNLLFRAKQRGTQEWVYGYPLRGVDCCHAAWMMYVPAANPDENNRTVYIDEATLGIWTGMQDKNQKRVFHGDIGVLTISHQQHKVETICNDAYGLCFDELPSGEDARRFRRTAYELEYEFEIVGNHWDNPELLEEQEEEIELRPCPFCGGIAFAYDIPPHKHMIFDHIPDYSGGGFVECTRCAAAVSGTSLENAIENWNRRVENGGTK